MELEYIAYFVLLLMSGYLLAESEGVNISFWNLIIWGLLSLLPLGVTYVVIMWIILYFNFPIAPIYIVYMLWSWIVFFFSFTIYIRHNPRQYWNRTKYNEITPNKTFLYDGQSQKFPLNTPSLEEEKRKLELIEKRNKLIPENYIKKILQHAERNYAKRDKYGNQNSGSLEKEIADYLLMIARQIGNKVDINSTEAYARGRSFPSLNNDYRWLIEYLRSEFQKFHEVKEQKLKSGELDISNMSWVEFERYLARIFEKHWYSIELTPESGDQWADIIAEKDQKRLVIQAKRYSGSVGNGAIQEVIWAIKYYDGTEWWVITNSIFTNSAQELAWVNRITLIDSESLENIKNLI